MEIKIMILVLIISFISMVFLAFEKEKKPVEKLVLIALLATIASIGRVVFSAIPSVQPSSFIIICTGIVFGPICGFMTGAICALTSSLILGFGSFVIYQILAWGLMGLVSGLLCDILINNRKFFLMYAFLWGLLFGSIMNIDYVISMNLPFSINSFILTEASSIIFDIMHGASNFLLVLFLGDKFIKILRRVAIKYGLVIVD